MKTIVLYKTMTGSTEKYAGIISEKLGADVFKLGRAGTGKVRSYDTVIFGGCVHSGVISGLKKFKNIARKCDKAKLIVFAVGASPEGEKTSGDLLAKNFPEGIGKIKFFYLKGGMDLQKMKQPFRGFMKWVKKMIEMNPDKKPDEIEFLNMFKSVDDPVNEKKTEELVRYVKGL